jgi:hypothetical protein
MRGGRALDVGEVRAIGRQVCSAELCVVDAVSGEDGHLQRPDAGAGFEPRRSLPSRLTPQAQHAVPRLLARPLLCPQRRCCLGYQSNGRSTRGRHEHHLEGKAHYR